MTFLVGCPLSPPVAPMLAKLARELPTGDVVYEPKWDGFRCLAFVCAGEVDLRSRNQKPLARYFPEVVESLRLLPHDVVLDGELLVTRDGEFQFDALLERIHPAASRVQLLAGETPASYVAFDLLAPDEDPTGVRFAEPRRRLEQLFPEQGRTVCVTPATGDVEVARRSL